MVGFLHHSAVKGNLTAWLLRKPLQFSSKHILQARLRPGAMVSDLIVLFAVRADFVAAHPRADHFASPRCLLVSFSPCNERAHAGLQDLAREVSIAVLTFRCGLRLNARGLVAHHHAGFGLVPVLTAGAAVHRRENLNVRIA